MVKVLNREYLMSRCGFKCVGGGSVTLRHVLNYTANLECMASSITEISYYTIEQLDNENQGSLVPNYTLCDIIFIFYRVFNAGIYPLTLHYLVLMAYICVLFLYCFLFLIFASPLFWHYTFPKRECV